MKQRILIVDDDKHIRSVFSQWFEMEGFEHHVSATLAEARQALREQCFDAILLDNVLPDGKGVEFVAELRAACPAVAVIIITGQADIPLAVEAIQRGADHFLAKPIDMASFNAIFLKCLEMTALRREHLAHRLLDRGTSIDPGVSRSMRQIMELAVLAAESGSSVLISGETGSGKGVVAKWIHDNSSRREKEFVDINCSSLRGDLLASVLFGHAKGSFTSAVADQLGLIEAADGGTLFLDEIGDMDLAVQASFLKVVEEKSYRRLGEVRKRRSDFRLICATNRDLAAETARRSFRKDLLFRLNALSIAVPALRDRREDIRGLVQHMLVRGNYPYRGVSDDVMALLEAYPWPGNVRELQNIIERAVLLGRGGLLQPAHFPGLEAPPVAASPAAIEGSANLEQIERESILSTLRRFQGNVDRVAEQLGISRATVYRKLKSYRPVGK